MTTLLPTPVWKGKGRREGAGARGEEAGGRGQGGRIQGKEAGAGGMGQESGAVTGDSGQGRQEGQGWALISQ